uniref:DNA polymerase epsilon subunit n=1 Tax=Oryza glumipatula TaxID=40148 RepID=A0A0E0AWE2_9ORYZ
MATPSAATRKKLQRKFRLRGFTLKVDALEEAAAFLARFPDAEDDALDLLLDELDKEPRGGGGRCGVSGGHQRALGAAGGGFVRRATVPLRSNQESIPADYSSMEKLEIKQPYTGIGIRLARDKYFSKPAFDTVMTEDDNCEITSIQSLIGCSGRRWIMGVISQLEERQFYLEDLTGANSITSFLSTEHKITSGFFVENTVILAEGELLSNGIFQVNTCGFPPLEDREASLSMLMGLDFFGGGVIAAEETVRLSTLEKKAMNDMFVILSDVWLDSSEPFSRDVQMCYLVEKTMEKLGVVLDGYDSVEAVPSLFVLMDNFCSRPCNLAFNSFEELRLQFGKLGEMIAARSRLKEHSRFLFIPGPEDAGPSKALPRCTLPKYLTEELQKHIPNAIFVSNPCRVKFYTQEIVFFQQDLIYRMRWSCLIPPTTEETSDPFEHLVATITHQSHLCPLPLTVQPIIWNYDHCLRLYPTPHTIVLGDKSEQKAFKYAGITCFNPGSFANDSSFAAYRPCTKEVELSALES